MYGPQNGSDWGKAVSVNELKNGLENLDIVLTIQIIPTCGVNPDQVLSAKAKFTLINIRSNFDIFIGGGNNQIKNGEIPPHHLQ